MNAEPHLLSDSLIFGIVATILTLITIIQTFRANKFAKRSAIAQGAFQKPNLQIQVFGDSTIDNFIVALPLGRQRVIEMPLQYTVLNRGEISAKGIEIFVRMSKDLRFGGQGKLVGTGASGKKVKTAVANETKNLETMVITINSLHPNQEFAIADHVSIKSSTTSSQTISAKTADNIDVTLTFRVEIAYAIDIIISQADQSPITRRISLSIVDTSDRAINEYLVEYNQKCLQKYRETISKLRLFARIKRVWFTTDNLKVVKLLTVQETSYEESEIPGLFNVVSWEMCNGFKNSQGYCIPALQVFWPDTKS